MDESMGINRVLLHGGVSEGSALLEQVTRGHDAPPNRPFLLVHIDRVKQQRSNSFDTRPSNTQTPNEQKGPG